jgi:DNA-binding MarR family transcriptional regulator
MRLEDEIKQEKFKNEYQKAIINIYFTNCFITSKFQDILKEYKITSQQYNILRILRGQYPKSATMGKIKERLLDRSSDITRMIDRLVSKKMVERRGSRKDRRLVEAKITQYGLEMLEKMDVCEDRMNKILSHLPEKEVKKLNELLDKVRLNG